MISKNAIIVLIICGVATMIIGSYFYKNRQNIKKLKAIDPTAWWNNDTEFISKFSVWLNNYARSQQVLDVVRNKRANDTYLQMLNSKGELYFNHVYVWLPSKNSSEFLGGSPNTIMTVKLLDQTNPQNEYPLYSINGSNNKWKLHGLWYAESANDPIRNGYFWVFWKMADDGSYDETIWRQDGSTLEAQLFLNVEKDACSKCCPPSVDSDIEKECRFDGWKFERWTPEENKFGTKPCPVGTVCREVDRSSFAETSLNTINPKVFSAFVKNTPELGRACCSPVPMVNPLSNAWKYACRVGGYDPKDPSGNKGLCDDVMNIFCDDNTNSKDPICGCYPKADHSPVEKAIMEKLKGTPLVNSSPSCVYSSCIDGTAYKPSVMDNTKCSQICGVFSNTEAGDYAHIEVNNVNYDIKCGDKGIKIETTPTPPSPSPPSPSPPSPPSKPDDPPKPNNNKNLGLIVGVSVGGLVLIGILIFIAYKML